jgi:hypothetical protein
MGLISLMLLEKTLEFTISLSDKKIHLKSPKSLFFKFLIHRGNPKRPNLSRRKDEVITLNQKETFPKGGKL